MIEFAHRHGPFDPRYLRRHPLAARPKDAQDRAVAVARAAEQAWEDDGGPALREGEEASL